MTTAPCITVESEANSGDTGEKNTSYKQILHASSIIGGAQVVTLVISLIRTKLVALLIGPTGVGLLGTYQSITELATTLAGFGLQASGVRDVVKAYSSEDADAVSKTVKTLRRACWITGTGGALLLSSTAYWTSMASFGTSDYAWPIAALGISIFFSNLNGGQTAIIQGTRRIGDLAQMNVLGAVGGSIVAVTFYATLGKAGIVPSLICISIVSFGVSSFYASKIRIGQAVPTWSESWKQSRSLARFGLAMVFGSVVGTIVEFVTRVLIINEFGLAGAGMYTAAYSLSGMFSQLVLSSMSADFYPRLTAHANDHPRLTQLMNEQTEVGLLLAFPGLLGTLALAPVLITVFYTGEFLTASDMLKWFTLGCIARVLSWPIGYSLLAKGQGKLFVFTIVAFNVVHISLIWGSLEFLGITGTSIAFAIANMLYLMGMLTLTWKTIGFSWSGGVWQQLSWMVPLSIIGFAIVTCLSPFYSSTIGVFLATASGVLCLRSLIARLGQASRIALLLKKLPGNQLLLRGL